MEFSAYLLPEKSFEEAAISASLADSTCIKEKPELIRLLMLKSKPNYNSKFTR